jgi:hypothetical protein
MNSFPHKISKVTDNTVYLHIKPTFFTTHRNNYLAQKYDKSDAVYSGAIATLNIQKCRAEN